VVMTVVDHLKPVRAECDNQPGLDFCGNLAHIFSFGAVYRPGLEKRTSAISSQSQPRHSRWHGRVETPQPQDCGWPDCAAVGEFRAPRSNRLPGDEGGWQYLCLDHVRAFNAGYNYFDGLSPDEIYAAQSPLAGWEKTELKGGRMAFSIGDPHGLFGDAAQPARPTSARWSAKGDAQALGALGLDRNATAADIRRAYRGLVRRYHPDSNGGDRSHEGKLQAVVNAFTHLKSAAGYTTESNQT
jgi:DnaJ domain